MNANAPVSDTIGVQILQTENVATIAKICFRVTWPAGSGLNGPGPSGPDENGTITYSYVSGSSNEIVSTLVIYQPNEGDVSPIKEVIFKSSTDGTEKKGDVKSASTTILPSLGSITEETPTLPRVLRVESAADSALFAVVMLRVAKNPGSPYLDITASTDGTKLLVNNEPSASGNDNVSAFGYYLISGTNFNTVEVVSTNASVSLSSSPQVTI